MKNISIITIASIVLAASFNLFLVPHEVILGGVTGIGMMIGILTPLNTGWVILALNIPIFVLGSKHLGKRFVFYSVYSVVITSFSMEYLPVVEISKDIMLSAVFGGVIGGIATGFIIKFGGSTGGLDIIGLVIAKKRDFSLGHLMMMLNSVIMIASGILIGWEETMYTLLVIFVFGKMVDAIHTKHVKLTLMIVTDKGEEIQAALLSNLIRGITVMDGEGAYTKSRRKVLMTVITRYELVAVKKLIQEIDNFAFVNITETVEVMGMFRRE